MINFENLDLYRLKGEEKAKAFELLFEIKNGANYSAQEKFQALTILAEEAHRREKSFRSQREIFLAEQHDLQIHQLETFKKVRLLKFNAKYAHEIEKGFMSPEAAKEFKKVQDKASNGCYTFATDGITVFERECQSCPKIGCKYHPGDK